MELLPYVHPLIGTLGLVLAFFVFRDGLAQRKQRLVGRTAPSGSRARHVVRGPWAAALIGAALVGGLGSAVFVRGWAPMDKVHGWVGAFTALLFGALWWLGRRLVRGDKRWAGVHGWLGLLALFAGGLTAVLGISLLP